MRVAFRAEFGSSPADGRISEPFRFRFDSFLLAMSGALVTACVPFGVFRQRASQKVVRAPDISIQFVGNRPNWHRFNTGKSFRFLSISFLLTQSLRNYRL